MTDDRCHAPPHVRRSRRRRTAAGARPAGGPGLRRAGRRRGRAAAALLLDGRVVAEAQQRRLHRSRSRWWPDTVVWQNYLDIWQKSDMTTWLGNTLLLSVIVTVLQVLTGSFAAYGFSKVRFPGRDLAVPLLRRAPSPCRGSRT